MVRTLEMVVNCMIAVLFGGETGLIGGKVVDLVGEWIGLCVCMYIE